MGIWKFFNGSGNMDANRRTRYCAYTNDHMDDASGQGKMMRCSLWY